MARIESAEQLAAYRDEIVAGRDAKAPGISICAGTGCLASGATQVVAAVEAELVKQGLHKGL